MKSLVSIFLSASILFVGSTSYCLAQSELVLEAASEAYVLRSQYQPGKAYFSQIDVVLAMDIEMGNDTPALRDKRIRNMAVTIKSEIPEIGDAPFKLNFTDFEESSSGELSDPGSDIQLDTDIAGATGSIENGSLVINNVCGIEPRYLDGIENVFKPVLELAYIHFPKKAMRLGDSFQNRFRVGFPVVGFGTVESIQDMVITLMSVENNMAILNIETVVSGAFVFEGVAYPVTGGGISTITLDLQNQYFTSFEKSHTDVITFKSGGTEITIKSSEVSTNRTVIE